VQTGGRKVALHNTRRVIANVIRSECRFLGRGETVDEAATVIEAYMRSDHPELVGKVA
jgi:hypothetical protein